MTSQIEHTAERRGTVELTIEARAENLALARLALTGVVAEAGASREVVADLKLAVTEACTNAIVHAHRGEPEGSRNDIIVRYTVESGQVEVEVEDRGVGFDPELVPEVDPARNGQGQGMGLMIIRQLVDELSVTSSSSGTRIAFVKRFSLED